VKASGSCTQMTPSCKSPIETPSLIMLYVTRFLCIVGNSYLMHESYNFILVSVVVVTAVVLVSVVCQPAKKQRRRV